MAADAHAAVLAEKRLARVCGIASMPERNGTLVKVGKRLHAETEQERWETWDDFTWVEAAYKRANLQVLPPLSTLAQALYRLLTTSFLTSRVSSNDLLYHLIAHENQISLLHLVAADKTLTRQLPAQIEPRLESMRSAARELMQAHCGFRLVRGETCIERPALPDRAMTQLHIMQVQAVGEMPALRINAAAKELPAMVALPPRADYLNAFAEALSAPAVAPYPVSKKAGGAQRMAQPVLYVPVGDESGPAEGAPARPLNALASALAGVAVRGDALLSSLEFRDSEGVEGRLEAREPCSLPTVVSLLHKRSADVVTFVAAKLGRPMLGARRIPRVEAWATGTSVAGAPHPSPKSLLLEYAQARPERVEASEARALSAWAVSADGISPPDVQGGEQPRGFRAGFSLAWPAGAPLPVGAQLSEDGSQLSMQTGIYSRKAASKAADKVQSAEPHAAVMLLDALHRRNLHNDAHRAAEACADEVTLPDAPVFSLISLEAERAGATAADEGPEEAHPAGSMLHMSYWLELLPPGTEALPPNAPASEGKDGAVVAEGAGGAEAAGGKGGVGGEGGEGGKGGEGGEGGVGGAGGGEGRSDAAGGGGLAVLEERVHDQVLLGGGVLVAEVEDLAAEMAEGETRRALVRATLLRQPVTCCLTLRLHKVDLPAEEAPHQLYFNKAFQPRAVSHGKERRDFVAGLIADWAPASLGDVGCGEGKLLEHLVSTGAQVPRLVGVDTVECALRRAGRKMEKALAAAATTATDGGSPSPQVELLNCDLASLRLHCEVLTLIEVVEHLESHVLEAVGGALLGGCAPRRLVVSTPNKEYNLNFVERPADWEDGMERVPDVKGYELRNPDHRFEWTRSEFKAWAEGLAHQYGYEVTFRGVGGGPFDEKVAYGIWQGPGPQTQVAVFEKQGPYGPTGGSAATPAPLHQRADAVVWPAVKAAVAGS